MVGTGAKVALVAVGIAGAAGVGYAIYTVMAKPSTSTGPVLTVNGSAGPLTVPMGELALSVTGGTHGGPLVIYINSTPSTKGASSTPGTDIFNASGDFGPWAFNAEIAETLYFAVLDVTTGVLSNWVEVTLT